MTPASFHPCSANSQFCPKLVQDVRLADDATPESQGRLVQQRLDWRQTPMHLHGFDGILELLAMFGLLARCPSELLCPDRQKAGMERGTWINGSWFDVWNWITWTHHRRVAPEAVSVHKTAGRPECCRSHSATSRARKRTFDSILKYESFRGSRSCTKSLGLMARMSASSLASEGDRIGLGARIHRRLGRQRILDERGRLTYISFPEFNQLH